MGIRKKQKTLTLLLFVKIDLRHMNMNFHPSSGIIVKIALLIVHNYLNEIIYNSSIA